MFKQVLKHSYVCAVLLMGILCTVPAQAQAQATTGSGQVTADEATPLGAFNRELVNKVKRSCIYIGIMTIYDGSTRFAGSGSGVIIMGLPDENAAYAVTNHHVAGAATNLQVETWDHRTYKAEMLTTDPGIDASLIKIYDISPDAYDVAVLGNSDEVQIGEPALAVGSPGVDFQMMNVNRSDPFHSATLQGTTTMRVVTGRDYNPFGCVYFWSAYRGEFGPLFVANLPYRFSTRAAINSGNSGGPLFDHEGKLIALNHAGGSSVSDQNSNSSIPINSVKKLVFEYLDKGTYEIPWFGMDMIIPQSFQSGQQIQEFEERYLDIKVLKVLGVRKNSPAERGGLKQGDIIAEFDGRTFQDIIDLRTYIFAMEIGRQVPVIVKRDGREIELTLEVGIKRAYDSEFSL